MLKQVFLVRSDLKLPKGKMAAQVAHASIESFLASSRYKRWLWRRTGAKKIVLKVKDLGELEEFYGLAKKKKLACAMIKDAGHTTVKPGTITCVGIGPDRVAKIDEVTGTLKMM